MIVKTEAVVLKRIRYGDSSIIATLYTLDYGKITVIAKGALRAKSRFAGALMPLAYLDIVYYEKKNGLATLSQADNKSLFHHLSNSYEHLAIGLAILESVDLKEQDDGPEPRLFAMLVHTIEKLSLQGANPETYFLLFQYHFATLQGYKINIKQIPPADDDIESADNLLAFYHDEGSILHRGNANGLSAFTFHIETFYILRDIVAAGFEECNKHTIDSIAFDELSRFFKSYFSYHLESKVEYKSLALLRG